MIALVEEDLNIKKKLQKINTMNIGRAMKWLFFVEEEKEEEKEKRLAKKLQCEEWASYERDCSCEEDLEEEKYY